MFYVYKSLISIDLLKVNTQNFNNINEIFYDCLSLIQLMYQNLIHKMFNLLIICSFSEFKSLTSIDISISTIKMLKYELNLF